MTKYGFKRRQKYVYFAVAGDMVKIGCSALPEQRLTQIAEWIPYKITLAATMDGGFAAEAALHRMFADEWSHLEWFHGSQRLMAFIARVAAGLPVEIVGKDHKNARRYSGLREKKNLSRRVHRAEEIAHDIKWYPALRVKRPAEVHAALESYQGAHIERPSAEATEVLEAYIDRLSRTVADARRPTEPASKSA